MMIDLLLRASIASTLFVVSSGVPIEKSVAQYQRFFRLRGLFRGGNSIPTASYPQSFSNDYISNFNWTSVELFHPENSDTHLLHTSRKIVEITTRGERLFHGDANPVLTDSISSIRTRDSTVSTSCCLPIMLPAETPSTKLATISSSIDNFSSSIEIPFKPIMLHTFSTAKALRLVWYYFLLYFFTVVYNVANKKVLDFLPLPATVSAVQTLIGIPLFLPLWVLKPPRNLDTIDRSSLMKISLCHGLGNLATVYALQSGSISFTHVIKSAEPLFTAILSIVVMKSILSNSVYLSLLPIVFGVGLASAKELSFSWFGFSAAMLSNFFYQLRMVLSKVSLTGTDDKKLSASNTFRVITIFSFVQLIPIALVLEGSQMIPAFYGMLSHPEGLKFTLVNILIAGASFYFYNEVGFWILDLVHPVTHAVGNTIKRVILVLASILIFRNPVNNLGLIGSCIAILGSFLYALASQRKSG